MLNKPTKTSPPPGEARILISIKSRGDYYYSIILILPRGITAVTKFALVALIAAFAVMPALAAGISAKSNDQMLDDACRKAEQEGKPPEQLAKIPKSMITR